MEKNWKKPILSMPEVFCKKSALKNTSNFMKKETLGEVFCLFSWDFSKL